jgi:hypothetical protein
MVKFDKFFVRRLVGDVERSGRRLTAQRADVTTTPERQLRSICAHEDRALLGEADGGRRADVARRRAGDDSDLLL